MVHDQLQFECRAHILIHMLSSPHTMKLIMKMKIIAISSMCILVGTLCISLSLIGAFPLIYSL